MFNIFDLLDENSDEDKDVRPEQLPDPTKYTGLITRTEVELSEALEQAIETILVTFPYDESPNSIEIFAKKVKPLIRKYEQLTGRLWHDNVNASKQKH